MKTSHNSIALLIDADNSPSAKIDFIISELASHGVVNIRRAYGNWKKPALAGWEKVLHENSIQPMQSFDLVKGKNATDMALVIDAMDILYTKNVNTFCLVSSDSDFTPLIQRLRADGKEVFGFGGKKTPMPFIASCTRFIYLDLESSEKQPGKKAAVIKLTLEETPAKKMAAKKVVQKKAAKKVVTKIAAKKVAKKPDPVEVLVERVVNNFRKHLKDRPTRRAALFKKVGNLTGMPADGPEVHGVIDRMVEKGVLSFDAKGIPVYEL